VKRRSIADTLRMGPRRTIATLVCALVLALSLPAGALAAHSVGSGEQIAWVRRAASNFVTAELAGDGASACAVLNAPLRATRRGRTCAQRWATRLSRLLREPGARARLRAQRHAIPTAVVTVHGDTASLELAAPLMSGPNRFVWSENCWMLAS
jgi:hypothetical protein